MKSEQEILHEDEWYTRKVTDIKPAPTSKDSFRRIGVAFIRGEKRPVRNYKGVKGYRVWSTNMKEKK